MTNRFLPLSWLACLVLVCLPGPSAAEANHPGNANSIAAGPVSSDGSSAALALKPSIATLDLVPLFSAEAEWITASLQKTSNGHELTIALSNRTADQLFPEIVVLQRNDSGQVITGNTAPVGPLEPFVETYLETLELTLLPLAQGSHFELSLDIGRGPGGICEVYCDEICWEKAHANCTATGGTVIGFDCGCNQEANHCRWTCMPPRE